MPRLKLFGAIHVIQFTVGQPPDFQVLTQPETGKEGIRNPEVNEHPPKAVHEEPVSRNRPSVDLFIGLWDQQGPIESQCRQDPRPDRLDGINDEPAEYTSKPEPKVLYGQSEEHLIGKRYPLLIEVLGQHLYQVDIVGSPGRVGD